MNKIDVLKELVAGRPPEKPLASFWGHFFKEEQHWETLLEITVQFQLAWDWDFVKINPSSCFIAEEWGNRYEKYDDRKQKLLHHRVAKPEDFMDLRPLPVRSGLPGDHLKVIKGLKERLPEVPLIMTIFSPLSYAGRLCGSHETLAGWIKQDIHESKIKEGLRRITQSIIEYSLACLEEGCHGIFYATTEWGDTTLLDAKGYEEFGMSNDLEILRAVKDGSIFTILHVCRSKNRLKDLLHYPADALSWDGLHESNPSLKEIAAASGKIILGGISQDLLDNSRNLDRLEKEIEEFCREMKGCRAILGPGCTFSSYDREVLNFVKKRLHFHCS